MWAWSRENLSSVRDRQALSYIILPGKAELQRLASIEILSHDVISLAIINYRELITCLL